ncbi:molybdenum cofactor sulfurase [Marinitoga sp. 1135]|uniref:MOSC domain-containing protein n=1 Tax=Marinitoga piezophila (strain DSM 14283 / JCM 11233 / KA3) TaxID=443254 RepID=H2J474_MARPK|nr:MULTISPECIES: MOSC domain-containing protein [Marinitoga]AEX85889.1 hypothetical protein Marpi_1494 [Marinitoga piezophila KA3]APT76324.1 molybdenum cofactor sulfurase [Marinitoga sp. 1137]NUU96095.1 molybdenum cofactor sulfurase [Marinitoga sp. 1135]NUU98002.1 molybdenum cofactor sulfurase [Marinitoga sp. 1138]
MKSVIISLNVSSQKGVPKEEVKECELIENWGIKGDAHAGKWHRQVSMLSTVSIEKVDPEIRKKLKYGDFAANIVVKDLEIFKFPVGTQVKINDALLEITQIGKECHEDNLVLKLTGKCITPEEGIFLKVIKGGKVKIGDKVEFLINK